MNDGDNSGLKPGRIHARMRIQPTTVSRRRKARRN
jgi:hypothetical protein